jgi:hypothetical protein
LVHFGNGINFLKKNSSICNLHPKKFDLKKRQKLAFFFHRKKESSKIVRERSITSNKNLNFSSKKRHTHFSSCCF